LIKSAPTPEFITDLFTLFVIVGTDGFSPPLLAYDGMIIMIYIPAHTLKPDLLILVPQKFIFVG
jgi:hypothetical protein